MGLSICTGINLALFIVQPRRYGYLYITVGAGLVCGILMGISLFHVFSDNSYHLTSLWKALFLGVSLTMPVSAFFIIKHKLSDTRFKLQKEQIKVLGNEKIELQSRLKLLQAQIEPHFLFNTLANIEGLQKKDGATARAMLNNLTCYLRTSLKKSRKTSIKLKEELTTIRAYLEIFQIRMGKRLRYRIEADDTLHDESIPPMLIQPLVENSILHGLEPKAKGGEILIIARRLRSTMQLEVSDTGIGLDLKEKQGVGLANVKERLALYYSGAATMVMEANQPTGLRIIIEIPCELPRL
jgi:LytS/YehU family sensor histidine kinase